MNTTTRSILVIDDNDDFREIIECILLDAEYCVRAVRCPDEAYQVLHEESFDLIICDLNMPFTLGEHRDEYPFSFEVGVKTIQELGWVFPTRPIIAVSAAAPSDIEKLRVDLGDLPVLSKPCAPSELLALVEQSLALQYLDIAQ